MLKFEGIKKDSTFSFLVFSNEAGVKIEIPIEIAIADRIHKYLAKISTAPTTLEPQVRSNLETSE